MAAYGVRREKATLSSGCKPLTDAVSACVTDRPPETTTAQFPQRSTANSFSFFAAVPYWPSW